MPIIKANEVEFYYEKHGRGDFLILIAGYACDHTFWFPVLDDLKKQYQVIIFDNHGIGQTKDKHGFLSIELMAKDVVALLDQLHIKNAHVVGQSMGGMIARTIAAEYPQRVNKLGIITSSVKCRFPILYAFQTMLQMRKDNLKFDLIFQTMLPWIFGENFLKDKNNIEILKKAYLDCPYPQTIPDQERQYHVLQQYNGENQLSHIHCPSIIVYGRQDMVTLPDESKEMANKISGSKLVELDCAHGIVAEVPQKLAKLLLEFLEA